MSVPVTTDSSLDEPYDRPFDRALHIWCMPWLGSARSLSVEDLHITPYKTFLQDELDDQSLRVILEKYFECFKNRKGQRAESASICYFVDKQFEVLSEPQIQLIRNTANSMAFSELSEVTTTALLDGKPYSAGPNSSDKFELAHHLILEDCVYYGSGAIRGASHLSVFEMRKPAHALDWMAAPEGVSLVPLLRLLSLGPKSEEQQRFLLALEWFRLATSNAPAISDWMKILMMALAFECVLSAGNLDNIGIAKSFDKLCGERYALPKTIRNVSGKNPELSAAGWWLWEFFRVRGNIAHGGTPSEKDLWFESSDILLKQEHVATVVLWIIIAHKLESWSLLTENAEATVAEVIGEIRVARKCNEIFSKLQWKAPVS